MELIRRKLLTLLANGNSVILNSTINIYEDGAEQETACIVFRGNEYTGSGPARPVIEVKPGALICDNTFRIVSGKANVGLLG